MEGLFWNCCLNDLQMLDPASIQTSLFFLKKALLVFCKGRGKSLGRRSMSEKFHGFNTPGGRKYCCRCQVFAGSLVKVLTGSVSLCFVSFSQQRPTRKKKREEFGEMWMYVCTSTKIQTYKMQDKGLLKYLSISNYLSAVGLSA